MASSLVLNLLVHWLSICRDRLYFMCVSILFLCFCFFLLRPPGCGVNLGMRGLESMGTFIYRTATAVDQNDILEALSAKMQHSRQVAETFRQTGLAESMYE